MNSKYFAPQMPSYNKQFYCIKQNICMYQLEQTPRSKSNLNGKIFKGIINDADIKMSTSSIPSKKQTLIYRNPTVSAFGSGVNRFRYKYIDQQPGPGSYGVIKKSLSNPSFSKKGYGPMLSKLERSINTKSNLGPGPGTYSRLTTNIIRRRSSSTMFSKQYPAHQIFKEETKLAKSNPSPGDYEYERKDSKLYSSMFKSNQKRLLNHLSDTPPPTQYNITSNKPSGKIFSIKIPQKIVKKQNVLARLFGKEKVEIGPGSYDFQLQKSKTFSIKENINDRFGTLKEEYKNKKKNQILLPGPGAYDFNQMSTWKKEPQISSVFQSATERKVFEGEVDKGPVFYNNSPPKKTNFLLNLENKWV